MYRIGRGVPKDTEKAIALYREAAEGGFHKAYITLADMYLKGEGLPKSEYHAYRHYLLHDSSYGIEQAKKLENNLTSGEISAARISACSKKSYRPAGYLAKVCEADTP